ncbi:uncharacterized protein LOC143860610 [Tasmannia lanceolata]|uniref:uncharacterized protein LOC143860610 n=1 Tax=Tasmannia lanceolata TaxID=3420 RepID=UPI004062D632
MDQKTHNLQEISENSSNSVASDTIIEVRYAETEYSIGEGIDSKEISENSSNPVPSVDIMEVRSAKTECDIGKDDYSIEISDNSSTLIASETVIEMRSLGIERSAVKDGDSNEICEHSSNSVASETIIEVRSSQSESLHGENCDSEDKANVLEKCKVSVEKLKVTFTEPEREACDVSNVKCSTEGLNSGNWDSEKVCRICHLGSDRQSDPSDLIPLGCACKDELGIAHRHCAEVWFKLKGNRCCEICGEAAKNITGVANTRFMEQWNERVLVHGSSSYSSERRRCLRGQPFCNFLMACLVIAFILPWFFRVNMF